MLIILTLEFFFCKPRWLVGILANLLQKWQMTKREITETRKHKNSRDKETVSIESKETIALVSIVKQPKWLGRLKFASDRICAHIVNDSLKNKTIACTQGLNVYQFTCVVTKKLLYSVFNSMRQRKIHE